MPAFLTNTSAHSAAPPSCPERKFQCHDGQCINGSLRCDSHFDCSDSSDELHCGKFEELVTLILIFNIPFYHTHLYP